MKRVILGTLLAFIGCLTVPNAEILAQEGNKSNVARVEGSPTIRYIHVDGDDDKFREDWWIQDGVTGGAEEFKLHYKLGEDLSIDAEGRAILLEDDYQFDLKLDKQNFGYLHAGYTEFRKYFDDTGGFFEPFSIPYFDLDKDLHLDIGNVFVEAGLTLPDWPTLILGYEHNFKDGEKSLLQWGSVTEGGITRKIFPAFKEIDERLDVIRAEINHEIGKVRLGDQFQYEHYSLDNTRFEQELNLDNGSSESVTVVEKYSHDAFFNTFHVDSHVNEKTYLSLGYLFNKLDGDASFRMTTVPFGPEPFDKDWFSKSIDVSQDAHVVNANAMLGPFRSLTFYGGIEGEKLDKSGDTDAVLLETLPGVGVVSPSALIVSDTDKWGLEENFGVRYTAIPRTTVYAEGKWTQQDIDLVERELEDGELAIDRDTDTWVTRQRYSVGFNTSPLSRTTFSARYRRQYRSNDYDHLVDNTPGEYPAFITDQDFTTDELMAKVSYRPMNRVQTSFQYQLVATDINTDSETTPPSSVLSGNYNANIYSAGVTVTPFSGLYVSGLVSYQDIRMNTFDNGVHSVGTYNGDVLSVIAGAGLALDSKTDLNAQYIFSYSDNFDNNSSDGLPLGVDNQRHAVLATLTRQISKHFSARLRYGFYKYDDPGMGGADDYTANLIAAGCSLRF